MISEEQYFRTKIHENRHERGGEKGHQEELGRGED